MDRLYFPNKVQAPPGGWRFRVPETGVVLKGVNEGNLIQAIDRHCKANGITVNYDISLAIEDYICKEVPHYCKHKGPRLSLWGRIKRSLDQVVSGTRILGSWLLSGEFASLEKAESRAKVCTECKYNQQPSGCFGCKKLDIPKFIMNIVGERYTSYDDKLLGCEVCGCFNRVKVHVPLHMILEKMPKQILEELPDNCWVVQEEKND